MATIKDKLHFNFDGIWSEVHGVINVNLDSGMLDEVFVADRDIVETRVKGNRKSRLHSVESSPIEFDMTIAFENGFTDSSIDSVVRWLFTDTYKPLYFIGNENKVFYCMPTNASSIVHNGLSKGYFTITMRCNSSSVYSPVIVTTPTTVATSSIVTIVNDGHYDVYPEISIKKTSIGNVVIESLDDSGSIFEVRNLTNQEDIYINCEKEIIETDLIGVYRYEDVIGEFPRILKGKSNRFKITGSCIIQFRLSNEYKF